MDKQKDWLPHLMDAVPIEARKNRTSMYTIALEGWRRGLSLKFYNKKEAGKLQVGYSLSYKEKVHHFEGSGGDLITEEAIAICEDKNLTNLYLSEAGVPVPEGRKFNSQNTDQEIIDYAITISYPLVLKPTNGNSGKGVVANIKNELELKEALYYVRRILSYDDILIQRYVKGEEIRVYVLGDKVLGAVNRKPANIVGDGISTIKKLIDVKNQLREKIPHLHFRPIKLDKEVRKMIESAGYTLDSVLKENEQLHLRRISNISTGGDPVDVTDQLKSEHIKVSINAMKAIPGLTHCGVDMILDKKNSSPVVLEINTKPGIGSHLFPIEGKAKNIPKEIIDYYFPETKEIITEQLNTYFDFKSILEPLNGISTSEIEVIPSGEKKHYAKKYTIIGNLELISYYLKIQQKAFRKNLNGFVRKIDDKTIEVIIASEEEQEVNNFKDILSQGKLISCITEEKWEFPIKLGFELRDGLNTMSIRELEDELKQKEKELNQITKEQLRLSHRIKMIRQSRTWKITMPIRYLSKKIGRK